MAAQSISLSHSLWPDPSAHANQIKTNSATLEKRKLLFFSIIGRAKIDLVHLFVVEII
jgi:hypothetical protein